MAWFWVCHSSVQNSSVVLEIKAMALLAECVSFLCALTKTPALSNLERVYFSSRSWTAPPMVIWPQVLSQHIMAVETGVRARRKADRSVPVTHFLQVAPLPNVSRISQHSTNTW